MVNQDDDERVVQAMNNGDATFAAPTVRPVSTCTGTLVLSDLDEVFANELTCGETLPERRPRPVDRVRMTPAHELRPPMAARTGRREGVASPGLVSPSALAVRSPECAPTQGQGRRR